MKLFSKKMKVEPALFASHGWPEMPLEPCELRDFFIESYRKAERPRAVLALSSRWRPPHACVGADERPQTIHDFAHSDRRLEELDFAVKGSAELSAKARSLLVAGGVSCKADPRRGLDCSIWGPLWLAFPRERPPVCPIALPESAGAEGYFKAGRCLRELRMEGVAIISCGQLFDRERAERALIEQPADPGLRSIMGEVAVWLRQGAVDEDVIAGLREALESSEGLGMSRSAGFLPLFFHLGLAFEGERMELAHQSVAYGAYGNQCHWIGKPEA